MARDGRTHPQRTETKNLSRDGFYCLLNEPLIVGEHFDCDIVVPTHAPVASSAMFLRCRVQVMRVEKVDSGDRYGLACRIEEYRVIHKAAGLVQNGRQHHDT